MTRISVVCPVYNSASFIHKTLEALVAQAVQPDEIIFCDDGSVDKTVELIKNYFERKEINNFRVLSLPHAGPGAARNAGIEASTCPWIAFLDSDDIWFPDKISTMKAAIETHPEVNLFCHDEISQDGNEEKHLRYGERYRGKTDYANDLYVGNMLSTSAVTVSRKLIGDCLFDESLSSGQDYEFWLQIARDTRPKFIPDVLGKYVVRKGNITSGSLFKRYRNEIKIWLRYAPSKPILLVVCRFMRLHISYLLQFIHRYKS